MLGSNEVLIATRNKANYLVNFNPLSMRVSFIYNCKHPVTIIRYSDPSFFVVGTENNKIYIYDTENAQPIRNFNFAE